MLILFSETEEKVDSDGSKEKQQLLTMTPIIKVSQTLTLLCVVVWDTHDHTNKIINFINEVDFQRTL